MNLRPFIHELAVEPVDGMRKTYSTPTVPTPGTLTPAINGRTRTVGFTISGSAVTFDEAPALGDVVSFFYTQA